LGSNLLGKSIIRTLASNVLGRTQVTTLSSNLVGRNRIENTPKYLVYYKKNGSIDLDNIQIKSETLPISIPLEPVNTNYNDYNILVRKRSKFGIDSPNQFLQTVKIYNGTEFYQKPSNPTSFRGTPALGLDVTVSANYDNYGVENNPGNLKWYFWVDATPLNITISESTISPRPPDIIKNCTSNFIMCNLPNSSVGTIYIYCALVFTQGTPAIYTSSDIVNNTVVVNALPVTPTPIVGII